MFFLEVSCCAAATVEKLVDDFAALPVVEQRQFSRRLEGTGVYSMATVSDVTEPGLFDRFGSKLYYKVTSELMTSLDKRKEFKIIYCYTDGKKAMALKHGNTIKGSGTLIKIESGVFWISVWIEMK